ncbi:hypothetical protein Scep_012224 [Stephania cephalantha]|uniref:Uncharacterized protein n=1 Tax=Stephania cephalantha TaxID=152367 RepID=A0AAP0JEJ6_9MAGN
MKPKKWYYLHLLDALLPIFSTSIDSAFLFQIDCLPHLLRLSSTAFLLDVDLPSSSTSTICPLPRRRSALIFVHPPPLSSSSSAVFTSAVIFVLPQPFSR